MMRKLKMTSRRSQETSFIVITLYPESNCTCREKNHFLFRWSASTLPEQHIRHGRNVGVKYWRLMERGWRKRIVRCMDRLHKNSFYWTEGHLTDVQMVREETYEETNYLSSRQCMARKCGRTCQMQQRWKAKQRWAFEKPTLDNARQLRRIFFIEPNDEEFKFTMKAARRKLEVPMPAAMPCEIPIKSSGETHRNVGKRKTKYACIVDADECTRPGLEGAGHKPHQDHITAKGMNSMTHCSLVHKFISMPQALKKIPNAKAAVIK